jgi:hypothetical protein
MKSREGRLDFGGLAAGSIRLELQFDEGSMSGRRDSRMEFMRTVVSTGCLSKGL